MHPENSTNLNPQNRYLEMLFPVETFYHQSTSDSLKLASMSHNSMYRSKRFILNLEFHFDQSERRLPPTRLSLRPHHENLFHTYTINNCKTEKEKKDKMSQAGKKRKLDMDEVKEYIENVNAGIVEGEYGENILKGCKDAKINAFLEKEPFEVLPLMYKGHQIGNGKCTHPICVEKAQSSTHRTFVINEGRKSGMKAYNIIRHCERNHVSAKEKSAKKLAEKSKQNQPSMKQFIPTKKKLSQETIKGMRQRNKQVISYNNTAIGFFGKKSVKDRDRYLLEQLGYDGNEVNKFDVGAESVKSDSRKTSLENRQFISSVADKCAEKGVFALAIDHKATANQTAEEEKWNIGVGVIFTDDDFEREYYLLDYIPVKDQSVEINAPILREVLQKYGFESAVQQGRVFFVGDSKMKALAKEVGPNCFFEICNFHDLGNLITAGTERHLEKFDTGANEKKLKLNNFISKARKDWSLKKMRNHSTNTARSINEWIHTHQLTEADKIRVAKFTKPKGWKDHFETDTDNLTVAERAQKANILSKITKLPKFKESISIRPRTIEPNLIAVLCIEPHYKEAKQNPDHPLYAHVIEMPINFKFVLAQFAVVSRIGSLINYFEASNNYQAGEYLTAMTHLVKWISEPESRETLESIELLNHKRALMAGIGEQLIQCYADAKNNKVSNRRVPLRVSDLSLMANRLYFLNSNAEAKNREENMRLREMRLYLARSNDSNLKKYCDLFKEETRQFGVTADAGLVKLGRILELDSLQSTSASSQNLLADDDDDDEPVTNLDELRTALYDMNDSSVSSEIKNFIALPFAHFDECKLTVTYLRKYFNLNLVAKANGVVIATKNFLPKEEQFTPMGPQVMKYWQLHGKTFGKLAKCAEFIFKAPTSSSVIERVFSQITNQIGQHGTRIHSDTLVVMNQSNYHSDKFIQKLKQFCRQNNIRFD